MPYETVFEITQKPFEWWWPAFGLIFVVLGVIFILFGPKLDRRTNGKEFGLTFAISPRLLGWTFVIFASFWTLTVFGFMYPSYREYVESYRTGHYSVVEGIVEDFHPMPYEGHQSECFRVNKEKFCYSDYVVSPAFNQSSSHGGPVRAGLPVRIAFVEDDNFNGQILRLEIRAGMVSSETERTALSKSEENKWKQRENDNPSTGQVLLGFTIAAFLISLAWNLDWRHYMRYWIESGAPYKPIWEVTFRAFFLACLLGSSIGLLRTITQKHRTLADFEKAAVYSLFWIGFFGAYDLFLRRKLRTKNQSATG